MNRVADKRRNARIAAAHASGVTARELAAKYGLTRNYVFEIIRVERGYKRPTPAPRRLDPEDDDDTKSTASLLKQSEKHSLALQRAGVHFHAR